MIGGGWVNDKIFVSYGKDGFASARSLQRDLRILGYQTNLDSPRVTDSLGSIANLLRAGSRLLLIYVDNNSFDADLDLDNRLNGFLSSVSLNSGSRINLLSARFKEGDSCLPELFDTINFVPDYERGLARLVNLLRKLNVRTANPSEDTHLNIGIIKNGFAPYAESIAQAFIETTLVKLNSKGIRPIFSEVFGFAESYNKRKNARIISDLIASFHPKGPDFLLTVGTQVSLSVMEHETSLPQIFAGVGDPKRCGLVKTTRAGRETQISGVQYGPSVVRRLNFLSALMPSAKWAFIYNQVYVQDLLFGQHIKRVLNRKNEWRPKFSTVSVTAPEVTTQMRGEADAFFGFYYLNREMESFLRSTNKPIVGIDDEDVSMGAVASTGSDDFLIGKAAVTESLMPSLFDQKLLGELPIARSEIPRYVVCKRNCRDRGLKVNFDSIKKLFPEVRILN